MLIHSVVAGKPARRGAVTVWMLVCLIVLIGMLAIGMDGGRMLEKRRHAQATADGAALAAAASLFQIDLTQNGMATGEKKNAAQSAALSLAAANGFNNDGTTSTVTVNTPPNSGVFTGQTDYVEVIVQYNLSKSFGAIFTKNNLPVTARAVAVGRPLQLGILVLSQSGSNVFQNSSDATVTLNGHVFINSSDSAAFSQTGEGTIIADTYDILGNFTNPGGGSIQGLMRTGVKRTPDPLLSLPAPDPGSLTLQSTSTLNISGSDKANLQPGVYKGGINISGSTKVVMSSGIYVLQGGGFQVSGDADLTANNVLIYNTSGTSPASAITINTNGNVNLSPSSSGAYQGISIFQDRSIAQALSISGNDGTTISGVVYAASAAVRLTGNGQKKKKNSDTLGGAYICGSMQIGGHGDFIIDPGNNPILTVPELALAE